MWHNIKRTGDTNSDLARRLRRRRRLGWYADRPISKVYSFNIYTNGQTWNRFANTQSQPTRWIMPMNTTEFYTFKPNNYTTIETIVYKRLKSLSSLNCDGAILQLFIEMKLFSIENGTLTIICVTLGASQHIFRSWFFHENHPWNKYLYIGTTTILLLWIRLFSSELWTYKSWFNSLIIIFCGDKQDNESWMLFINY